MSIKINVGTSEQEETKPTESPIKITVGETDSPKMSLIARKSIDGHILIMDHDDIDIVVIPDKKKIICFPKKSYQDSVYDVQDRLFNYLGTKGVITRESVHSGNVYGSLEAQIPEAIEGINPIQMVVFSIGKFLEEEKPHMEQEKYLEDEYEEHLTDPDAEDSTELGQVKQAAQKGTIPKGMDPYKSRRFYVGGTY